MPATVRPRRARRCTRDPLAPLVPTRIVCLRRPKPRREASRFSRPRAVWSFKSGPERCGGGRTLNDWMCGIGYSAHWKSIEDDITK